MSNLMNHFPARTIAVIGAVINSALAGVFVLTSGGEPLVALAAALTAALGSLGGGEAIHRRVSPVPELPELVIKDDDVDLSELEFEEEKAVFRNADAH